MRFLVSDRRTSHSLRAEGRARHVGPFQLWWGVLPMSGHRTPSSVEWAVMHSATPLSSPPDARRSPELLRARRGLSSVSGQWSGIRQFGAAFPTDRGGAGAEQERLRAGGGRSQRRRSRGGAGRVMAHLPPDLGQGRQPGHARGGSGSPWSWPGPFVDRPGGLPAGCGWDGLHRRCRAERSRAAGSAPLGRLHRDELPCLVVTGGRSWEPPWGRPWPEPEWGWEPTWC